MVARTDKKRKQSGNGDGELHDKEGWLVGIRAALGMIHRPDPPVPNGKDIREIAAEIDRMGEEAEKTSKLFHHEGGIENAQSVEEALKRLSENL